MRNFLQLGIRVVVLSFFALALTGQQIGASPLYSVSECNVQDEPIKLKDAISKIEAAFGYTFAYSANDVNVNLAVNYTKTEDINTLLEDMLGSTPIAYAIKGKQIILTKKIPFNLNIKVVDQKNAPIPGATVIVIGTTKGGISMSGGELIIDDVVAGNKIEVSCMGYEPQILTASSLTDNIVVKMKVSDLAIQDVVVTGYQVLSKDRATGAFDVINKEQLEKPTDNIASRIIGTTAGLSAVTASDGSIEFEIRGQTSLYADTQPLIVVDGFAVEDGFSSINPNDVESITVLKDAAAASIWGARSANGVIVVTTKKAKQGSLNVSVSAFYKFSDKLDVNYLRPSASSSDVVDYELYGYETGFFGGYTSPITSSTAWTTAISKAYSKAISLASEYDLGYITEQEYNSGIETLRNTNNTQEISDYMLANAATQQYNVSVSGGTERLSHNLSLLYSGSNNNFQFNDNKEYLINYKTQAKLAKWLDFSFSGMLQHVNSTDGGLTASSVTSLSPYDNLYNEDGSYAHIARSYNLQVIDRYVPTELFPYSSWEYNPIQEAANTTLNTKEINARIQAALTANIAKGLTFTSSMQYEIYSTNVDNVYNEETFTVRSAVNTAVTWDKTNTSDSSVTLNLPMGSFRDMAQQSVESYNFRNQANFNRKFNDKHEITAIAGTEVSSSVSQNTTYPRAYGYNEETLSTAGFQNGNVYTSWLGYTAYGSYTSSYTYATDRYFSAYANASYAYDGKYTFTGSVRTDASNLVSDDPKYRYSPFWSVGGGWHMHKESFMRDYDFVNQLSLRATYGYNGNVDKTTSFVPLISMDGSQNIYTLDYEASISSYGNPSLRWEKTRTVNLGTDYKLFNGKLTGSIDYYHKNSTDLIVSVSIPSVNGTESTMINQGEMVNKGIELSFGTTLKLAKNIMWYGDATFSYNKNEITSFYKEFYKPNDLHSGTSTAYMEGYDANSLWSYQYLGMYNFGTEDSPSWQPAVQGDGDNIFPINSYQHTTDGRTHLVCEGTTVAPYNASFASSFQIFDFDLSFIVTGKFGHVFRRTGFNYPTLQPAMGATSTGAIPNKYLSEVVGIADAISNGSDYVPVPESEKTYYAQWLVHIAKMDYLTEDASHIRFQEVSLGYTLPQHITERLGFSFFKVYVQANNVGTILFNSYGEDPEYPYGTIKPTPTYTFGFKLNF